MVSSIAVQQREKEVQSLKSFLAFSLLGSLALHIGLLASGIGNFLSRTPDLADEPMEVVVVDPPIEQVKPQPEPQPQQRQPSKAPVAASPGSSRIGGQSPAPRSATRIPSPAPRMAPSRAIVAEKQPQAKAPQAIQKPVESVKPEPAPEIAATPKPVQTAPSVISNQQLKNTLAEARAARGSGATAPSSRASSASSGTGNGTGNVAAGTRTSTGTGTGIGNGYGRGSGTDTGTGNGSNQGTPQGRGSGAGDAEGTGSGRLACRECGKPKYPEKARRRGVEGSTKVKLEVDNKGNVTNVKLAQSSGNDDLDKEAVRAARRWKLKNPKGGTQGIVAKVDFALEGSQRARRAEERRKRREARRKRQQEAASSQQRPSQAAAPRQQQRQPQSTNNSQPAASDSQSRLRQVLRRQGE